ncbi:hypothetical protein J5N97_015351 [Dioscorea zingiberensis]|uniref:BRCT domain-containing protein n=1 Tax=Dioscorea zingiberensis TaxID=325984 RepID=A0A9D5HL29_9LILI|nr:hypothetical protein J5N97_015351 [Dioscorea zingiberensis]
MLAAGEGPGAIFAGVRFVLFGFDSVSEAQYRSEIVRRGGVDVGRYDSNCTHVIVSGRVSDEPVCVTARKDGKVLVSEMWIDDCLDFGTLVDANRVLYKPVKDLNGIPGSEALNICLTGYQRQDRDDIMKMVSLIGARFSKPLIANQVTHLICYKFEGEKYELARKVGIKLVNHRWLEDCLKVWEILPIDNYTKSGWELEILEAQARDSEEETEDVGRSAMRKRSSIGSSSLQGGMPSSTNLDVSVPAKDAEDLMNDRPFMTTPHKEPSYGKSIGTSGFINKVIGDLNHQNDVGTNQAGGDHATVYAKSSGDMSIQGVTVWKKEGETTPSSNKRDIKISPNPAAAKESSSTLSYSRKTPRKLVSAELPNNISGSPEGISEENLTVHPNFPQFEPSESRTHLELAGAQSPIRVVAHHMDSPASAMTIKRRSPLSSSHSKLPKPGSHGSEAHAIHGPLPSLGQSGSIAALFREGIDYPLGVDNSLERAAHTESGGHQSMDSSKKLPKLGCQGSEAHATQDPLASSGQFGSNAALFREGIHYGLGVDNSLERATNTESGGHQPTDSTKFKRLSYQKRSLKHVQPFKKTKISNSRDATGGDLANSQSKLEPSEILAAQMSELHNTPTRENAGSCVTASPTGGKTFPILPLVGDTLQTRDVNITDQSHCTETLVIDGRMINDASGKEQPFENLGDVNISDTANDQIKEIELHQKVNHDEVIMSSHSKEAETIKQSSIENVDTDKKDDLKTASCKKVVAKKSSYRHTLSNDNDKKDRIVTSLDKIESSDIHNKIYTSNQSSAKHGKAARKRKDARTEKGRATLKSEKKGNAEDKQEPGKKIIYEQNGTNAATKDDVIMEDAVESNSMPTRSILNVTRDRMESSNKEVKEIRLPNSGRNCKDLETNSAENSIDSDKENKPVENGYLKMELNDNCNKKSHGKNKKKSAQNTGGDNNNVLLKTKCAEIEKPQPACFILSGHRLQRKEFLKLIRHLRGRSCRDSHQWSYQATHFIVPDPVRRTEKFFAAAASGRWILKTDYLTASNEAGKFLDEESFEWHRKGLTEDGAISLEAPRKWRLLRERTGHGAFYGMRIIVYGECIAPTLDTLKRVVKAGDGTILATSPPYTRFLKSGVDYAVVSPSMPSVDIWVQEFLRHEVPCVVADYLVEYVCKPGYSLERHVLYKTHAWAEKSSANLLRLSKEVVTENSPSLEDNSDETDDLCCAVCGLRDRAEVMLICGDENGTVGCGIGTHIDCCDPQLDAIPEEDWFCPNCSNRTASKASVNNKRAKKSSSSKVK